MELLSLDEARQRILDMAESRKWWIFPHANLVASHILIEIEERHYAGEANSDFQIVMLPGTPIFAVSFAHKRRMSARSLAKIMVEMGAAESVRAYAAILKTQDIVILMDIEGHHDEAGRVLLWHDWVMGWPAGTSQRQRAELS